MTRCARHSLLGCALCGATRDVVSAAPTKAAPRREVKRPYDNGLAVFEAKLAAIGYVMTPALRAQYLREETLKSIAKERQRAGDFDTNSVSAVLQADIDSRSLRGRVYQLRNGTVTCPKCTGRTAVGDMHCISGYDVRIPNFSGCDAEGCSREAPRAECAQCQGKGYFISSWTQTTGYLACTVCVARMRMPTRAGSATNFTTTSRAGEEGPRKLHRAAPMCTSCQQRYARKGQSDCRQCHESDVLRKAREAVAEVKRLKAEIARLEALGAP